MRSGPKLKIKMASAFIVLIVSCMMFSVSISVADKQDESVNWKSNTKVEKKVDTKPVISGKSIDLSSDTFKEGIQEDTKGSQMPDGDTSTPLAVLAGLAGVLGLGVLTGRALRKKEIESLIPEGNGVWVPQGDRELVGELINNSTSKSYVIDNNGFVSEDDGEEDYTKSETFSKILDALINGDRKVVLSLSDGWTYYDPETDQLTEYKFEGYNSGVTIGENRTDQVVVVGKNSSEREVVLAHEMVHALRGQYGLENILEDGIAQDEEILTKIIENKIRSELGYDLNEEELAQDDNELAYKWLDKLNIDTLNSQEGDLYNYYTSTDVSNAQTNFNKWVTLNGLSYTKLSVDGQWYTSTDNAFNYFMDYNGLKNEYWSLSDTETRAQRLFTWLSQAANDSGFKGKVQAKLDLRQLRYYGGTIDNVWGADFNTALLNFGRDYGKPTGDTAQLFTWIRQAALGQISKTTTTTTTTATTTATTTTTTTTRTTTSATTTATTTTADPNLANYVTTIPTGCKRLNDLCTQFGATKTWYAATNTATITIGGITKTYCTNNTMNPSANYKNVKYLLENNNKVLLVDINQFMADFFGSTRVREYLVSNFGVSQSSITGNDQGVYIGSDKLDLKKRKAVIDKDSNWINYSTANDIQNAYSDLQNKVTVIPDGSKKLGDLCTQFGATKTWNDETNTATVTIGGVTKTYCTNMNLGNSAVSYNNTKYLTAVVNGLSVRELLVDINTFIKDFLGYVGVRDELLRLGVPDGLITGSSEGVYIGGKKLDISGRQVVQDKNGNSINYAAASNVATSLSNAFKENYINGKFTLLSPSLSVTSKGYESAKINVTFPVPSTDGNLLKVFDSSGKLVYSSNNFASNGEYTVTGLTQNSTYTASVVTKAGTVASTNFTTTLDTNMKNLVTTIPEGYKKLNDLCTQFGASKSWTGINNTATITLNNITKTYCTNSVENTSANYQDVKYLLETINGATCKTLLVKTDDFMKDFYNAVNVRNYLTGRGVPGDAITGTSGSVSVYDKALVLDNIKVVDTSDGLHAVNYATADEINNSLNKILIKVRDYLVNIMKAPSVSYDGTNVTVNKVPIDIPKFMVLDGGTSYTAATETELKEAVRAVFPQNVVNGVFTKTQPKITSRYVNGKIYFDVVYPMSGDWSNKFLSIDYSTGALTWYGRDFNTVPSKITTENVNGTYVVNNVERGKNYFGGIEFYDGTRWNSYETIYSVPVYDGTDICYISQLVQKYDINRNRGSYVWNAATSTVTVTLNGKTVEFKAGPGQLVTIDPATQRAVMSDAEFKKIFATLEGDEKYLDELIGGIQNINSYPWGMGGTCTVTFNGVNMTYNKLDQKVIDNRIVMSQKKFNYDFDVGIDKTKEIYLEKLCAQKGATLRWDSVEKAAYVTLGRLTRKVTMDDPNMKIMNDKMVVPLDFLDYMITPREPSIQVIDKTQNSVTVRVNYIYDGEYGNRLTYFNKTTGEWGFHEYDVFMNHGDWKLDLKPGCVYDINIDYIRDGHWESKTITNVGTIPNEPVIEKVSSTDTMFKFKVQYPNYGSVNNVLKLQRNDYGTWVDVKTISSTKTIDGEYSVDGLEPGKNYRVVMSWNENQQSGAKNLAFTTPYNIITRIKSKYGIKDSEIRIENGNIYIFGVKIPIDNQSLVNGVYYALDSDISTAVGTIFPDVNVARARYNLMKMVGRYPVILNYKLAINSDMDQYLNDCLWDFGKKFGITYSSYGELYTKLQGIVDNNTPMPGNTIARYNLMQLAKRYQGIFNYNLAVNADWDNYLNSCLLDFAAKYNLTGKYSDMTQLYKYLSDAVSGVLPAPKFNDYNIVPLVWNPVVECAQRYLLALNEKRQNNYFDLGVSGDQGADGKWVYNGYTFNAIKQFQSEYGLAATGYLDSVTYGEISRAGKAAILDSAISKIPPSISGMTGTTVTMYDGDGVSHLVSNNINDISYAIVYNNWGFVKPAVATSVNNNLPSNGSIVEVLAGSINTTATMINGVPYTTFENLALALGGVPGPIVNGNICWTFKGGTSVIYNTEKINVNGEYGLGLVEVRYSNGRTETPYYFPQKVGSEIDFMIDVRKLAEIAGYKDQTYIRQDGNGKGSIVIGVPNFIVDNSSLGSMAVNFLQGLWEALRDAVKDIWDIITNPGQIIEGIKFLAKALLPGEEQSTLIDSILGMIQQTISDFAGGTNDERAKIAGKTIGTILLAIIGDKGCKAAFSLLKESAKAGQLAKVASALSNKLIAPEDAVRLTKLAAGALGMLMSKLVKGAEAAFEVLRETTQVGSNLVLTFLDGTKMAITYSELSARLVAEGIGNKIDEIWCFLRDGCFTGDTLIMTETGLRRIDEIQQGDFVLAKDVRTGDISYKKVLQVYIKSSAEFVCLNVGGEEIRTTASHLFFVSSGWWKTAESLKTSDKIVDSNGIMREVMAVNLEKTNEQESIYNLNVEDYHTYFVGSQGLLVHNSCFRQDFTNAFGRALYWVDQNIKNVNIAIDSALNSTNVGKALEGKVANYIRNNIKEVTGFGQQVTRTVEKTIAGDLDVVTADAIIEVKKSIGAVSFDQICKYADPSHADFMNNLNKKVVLYIDEAVDMTNSNNLKLINDIKAKGVSVVINSLEGLKGVLN